MPPRRNHDQAFGEGAVDPAQFNARLQAIETTFMARIASLEADKQAMENRLQQQDEKIQEQEAKIAQQQLEAQRASDIDKALHNNQAGLEEPPINYQSKHRAMYALWVQQRESLIQHTEIYHEYKGLQDPSKPNADYNTLLEKHHAWCSDNAAVIGAIKWVCNLSDTLTIPEQLDAVSLYLSVWRTSTARTSILKDPVFAKAAKSIDEVACEAKKLLVKKRNTDRLLTITPAHTGTTGNNPKPTNFSSGSASRYQQQNNRSQQYQNNQDFTNSKREGFRASGPSTR